MSNRIRWEYAGVEYVIADLGESVAYIAYSSLTEDYQWDISECNPETAAIGDTLANGSAPSLYDAKRAVRIAVIELGIL